jgi:hypothetical protein
MWGSRVGRRTGLVVLAAAAVVVSACGSSSKESAPSPKPAGAQENAVATAGVCHDWPAGTTVVPCAVDAMGPGGGRVFYDAGSVQPWGRFLEVAPQAWGPDGLIDCEECGAAPGVTKESSDGSFYPCRGGSTTLLLPGEAGDTPGAIGDGRRNTELLLQTPECVNGTDSAVTVAAGYRGGGLADWYLPSEDELRALCLYGGRNAIGGFWSRAYLSSTTNPFKDKDMTDFREVDFGDTNCGGTGNIARFNGIREYIKRNVRPIRAFSQLMLGTK